jgi:hypothetical protein
MTARQTLKSLPVGFIALSPKKYILDGDGFT